MSVPPRAASLPRRRNLRTVHVRYPTDNRPPGALSVPAAHHVSGKAGSSPVVPPRYPGSYAQPRARAAGCRSPKARHLAMSQSPPMCTRSGPRIWRPPRRGHCGLPDRAGTQVVEVTAQPAADVQGTAEAEVANMPAVWGLDVKVSLPPDGAVLDEPLGVVSPGRTFTSAASRVLAGCHPMPSLLVCCRSTGSAGDLWHINPAVGGRIPGRHLWRRPSRHVSGYTLQCQV